MFLSARFQSARQVVAAWVGAGLFILAGCNACPTCGARGAGMQAMPVLVQPATLNSVPNTETYVATIKSRRSATLQPQVDGNLTKILVKSGDTVKAGQVLMQIDPLKQVATVQAQQGTEQQQKASLRLQPGRPCAAGAAFQGGIISKQAYDQARAVVPELEGRVGLGLRADQHAARATCVLPDSRAVRGRRRRYPGAYRATTSPPTTMLTTVDENKDLEAYIYVPTEPAAQVQDGLAVDLLDESGAVLAHTAIDFVSPQVDNSLQGILAKAPIPKSAERLRNGQIVNARMTWSTTSSRPCRCWR